ncbi:MAG TPA: CoA transferase subunit A [Acidimicrobiales bacterium]|nr:CoA transferase subunit A [Acidimicrobiales bacterium]
MSSASEAVADITDGASLAVGGFGLCGIPSVLIAAVAEAGVSRLHVVSNNCGVPGKGLGILLDARRIAKITASYVGENDEFERQYVQGEVEVELVPQGTIAERLRAGGCGVPAFYTRAGVGTLVAEGGLPTRFNSDGTVAESSAPKETRVFSGLEYVLVEAIVCDFALVRAHRADVHGNAVFHATARNLNPLCAMAGRVTILEAEEIVEAGEIAPDDVQLPGIFVHRVVAVPFGTEKPIERLITRVGR